MMNNRLSAAEIEPFLKHLEEVEDAFLALLEAHPRLSRLQNTPTVLSQLNSLRESAKRFKRETE